MQALDGTKVAANAAGDKTYDAAGLERLLARTDTAIGELESQNEGGDDPPPPRLPTELQRVISFQRITRLASLLPLWMDWTELAGREWRSTSMVTL